MVILSVVPFLLVLFPFFHVVMDVAVAVAIAIAIAIAIATAAIPNAGGSFET